MREGMTYILIEFIPLQPMTRIGSYRHLMKSAKDIQSIQSTTAPGVTSLVQDGC